MKYLVIDACARKESRTRKLYKAYLNSLDGEIKILNLYNLDIKPLTEDILNYRDSFISKGDYSDPIFNLANDFITYDEIIIAAPYWDLSFPSILKVYFENISISGLTFQYEGSQVKGLAKAKRIIYISTSGGNIYGNNLAYDYIKAIGNFFGIKECLNFTVEGLDINPEKENELLENGIKKILEFSK